MPTFERDGIQFHYLDVGTGIPFIFQHGLGGDVNQTAGVYDLSTAPSDIRFIALDSRVHGETSPLGSLDHITFSTFADDVIALIDHLGLSSIVLGGISMGAGVSLNLTIRYPERVSALILSRLAWLDQPFPPNLALYVKVGELIQQYGSEKGLAIFQASSDYLDLKVTAPDTANSFISQFLAPHAEERVARLLQLPNDAPFADRLALSQITVPTLILANHDDPPHPYSYGEVVANLIPNSQLVTIPSKSIDKISHMHQSHDHIHQFIHRHFIAKGGE